MGAGCGRLDDTTGLCTESCCAIEVVSFRSVTDTLLIHLFAEEGRRIAHHLKSLNADFVPVQPDPSYCRLKELCLELPIDRFCAALGLREVIISTQM